MPYFDLYNSKMNTTDELQLVNILLCRVMFTKPVVRLVRGAILCISAAFQFSEVFTTTTDEPSHFSSDLHKVSPITEYE